MEIENRKRSDDTTVVQPPAHKKPRADGQSYSWEGKSSKVCIPLYCYGRTIHDRECNICVVDLSEETHDFSPSLDPSFKIKYVPDAADGVTESGDVREGFCALGNRLYIFESCVFKEKKAVYSIDISPALDTQFVSQTLLSSNLPKIGEMLSSKYNPAAVVVPNTSKILVFPTELFHKHKGKGFKMSNIIGGFELFDTVDGSSRELPSIQLPAPIRGCHIEAYGFIDTHRLLVQILDGEIYVLDLDSLNKNWVPTANTSWVDRFAASSRTNSTSFEVVEGRFCFRTSGGIRDLQVGKEGEEYDNSYLWVLSEDIPDMHITEYFLKLLNHDEQAGEFCICRLTVEACQRPKKSVRMQFDVAVLDLKLYKQELELPGKSIKDYTRSVKSLRYSLNLQGAEYKVFPHRTFFSF